MRRYLAPRTDPRSPRLIRRQLEAGVLRASRNHSVRLRAGQGDGFGDKQEPQRRHHLGLQDPRDRHRIPRGSDRAPVQSDRRPDRALQDPQEGSPLEERSSPARRPKAPAPRLSQIERRRSLQRGHTEARHKEVTRPARDPRGREEARFQGITRLISSVFIEASFERTASSHPGSKLPLPSPTASRSPARTPIHPVHRRFSCIWCVT